MSKKNKIIVCLLVVMICFLVALYLEVTDVKEVTSAPTLPSSGYQLDVPE